ncbi:hypothetical protein FNT36_19835 [Hymenobacter setariae]|uniref:Uncharacterized protein n=1 Tax=Hymenobacter setariae TaxID=2594794 RepID=A0A558BPJ4_9BACT|nr:hypothetical protein [Hymenobacter setariae]TVT38444.1 hypothetical protein FNT36_19835 [Hymenobacter setariae]
MGDTFHLVNLDKQESIQFSKIPAAKMREIAGSMAAASITTWYLLNNRGDRIAFLSAYESEHHLFGQTYLSSAFNYYPDVTDAVVEQLIEAKVLRDAGILWEDEDDRDLVLRDLRNIWDVKAKDN